MIYILTGIVLCMTISGIFSVCGMTTKDDDTFKTLEVLTILSYSFTLVLDIIGFCIL